MASNGVGARVRRKEDSRFLYGEGQYIGDLQFPRMRDVAFVRSPVAHARLKAVLIPEHLRSSVFIAGDLAACCRLGRFRHCRVFKFRNSLPSSPTRSARWVS